jgi:hypothetical protein
MDTGALFLGIKRPEREETIHLDLAPRWINGVHKDHFTFHIYLLRNEKVLHRVKEERNILHTIKRRKANWIGHILRKNCFLKHLIEGKDRNDGNTRKKA